MKNSGLRKLAKNHPTIEQRKGCSVLLSLNLSDLCSVFTWTVCRRGEECGNLFVDVFISYLVRTVSRDPYPLSLSGYFYSELISGCMELEKENLVFCSVIAESCFFKNQNLSPLLKSVQEEAPATPLTLFVG